MPGRRTEVRKGRNVAASAECDNFCGLEDAAAIAHREGMYPLGDINREDEEQLARSRRQHLCAADTNGISCSSAVPM